MSERTVWKYPFRIDDVFTLDMPEGATVVRIEEQIGDPCMWALVDPAAPKHSRTFALVGTGFPCPTEDQGRYVGTFLSMHGRLVWHVFEENRGS